MALAKKMGKCSDFFKNCDDKTKITGTRLIDEKGGDISADILILAVGFGNDGQKSNGTKPYWEFDQEIFTQLNDAEKKISLSPETATADWSMRSTFAYGRKPNPMH